MSTTTGVAFLPSDFSRSKIDRFRRFLVGAEHRQIRIVPIRFGDEVEKVEGAVTGPGEVGDDGRHDAAGCTGDDEDGVLVQREAGGGVGQWTFGRADGKAAVVDPADLDRPGITLCFGDDHVGQCRRLAAGREVDRFDDGVGPFTLERFGDADDATTQRIERSFVAVAVQPSQTGAGHHEAAVLTEFVVEVAQNPVQQLDS